MYCWGMTEFPPEDHPRPAGLFGPLFEILLRRMHVEVAAVLGEHAHLSYLEGNIYAQKGQNKEAEAAFKAALELQPDHPFAKSDLAAVSG